MSIHDSPAGYFAAHDSVYSASLSPVDVLLADPSRLRSWLFDAQPRDPDTSTDPVTTVRVALSSDGHKRHSTDAEEIQFPQAIVQPLALKSTLGGQLFGVAGVDNGEVVIGDPATWHRTIASYDWYSRVADIYLGPRNGRQVDFRRVAQVRTRGRRFNRDSISILVDDYSFLFDRLLQTNYYAGSGGLEGPSTLAGRAKPILIGQVDQIEPIAVDGINLIYQIHDGDLGAMESIDYVKVANVSLSFDADYADIASASPATGEYSTSLAQGVIKLGDVPSNIVVVGAKGLTSPTYGYVNTVAPIVRALAVDFAPGLDSVREIDTRAFDALAASNTAVMGWYFREPGSRKLSLMEGIESSNLTILATDSGVTVRDAMSIFLRSAMAFARMLPTKVLTIGTIPDPSKSDADVTLDSSKDALVIDPFNFTPYELPVGRVLVGYNRYEVTLDIEHILVASSADIGVIENLRSEYRWALAELTGNNLAQNDDYQTIKIETALYNESDASDLADSQLELRRVPRDIGTISLYGGLLQRTIGEVVEVIDDKLDASPRSFVVLGVSNEAASGSNPDKVELEVYG